MWTVDAWVPNCLGFAIRREVKGHAPTWLKNRIGFRGEHHTDGETRDSVVWPFQGFSWTDHEVSAGDVVRYKVVPVLIDERTGRRAQAESQASAWSKWRGAPAGDVRFEPFFNRGYVISQFMARWLRKRGQSLDEFKRTVSDAEDRTIRHFLAGDLRTKLLAILDQAIADGSHVYGALFELLDDELTERLVSLGPRAHLVLANGSIQWVKGVPAAEARKKDENAEARRALLDAEVDVGKRDRFTSPGALGHNKFLVVTDHASKASLVWTGSTNWTPTGLCTQLNNGLVIRDRRIAAAYLEQWRALRGAKSGFTSGLVEGNSKRRELGDATVWFTRTRAKVDLDALREVVDSAGTALLCLMFRPGAKGLLADVLRKRVEDPGLYVRGVISDLPSVPPKTHPRVTAETEDESVVDVTLLGADDEGPHRLDMIQPEGLHAYAYWAAEVTRGLFLSQVGYAIIHSKVLVIDPLTNPVVVTGSHNFSDTASTTNDENFIIVRGDEALAEAYMVNILAAWRHYRFRAGGGAPYQGLDPGGGWMAGSLWARKRDSRLWGF